MQQLNEKSFEGGKGGAVWQSWGAGGAGREGNCEGNNSRNFPKNVEPEISD